MGALLLTLPVGAGLWLLLLWAVNRKPDDEETTR